MLNANLSKRLLHTAGTLAVWLSLCGFSVLDPLYQKIEKGNELYRQGEFDEAMKKYMDALQDDPLLEIIHYNMGNVWFKQDKLDNAIEEYEKTLGAKDLDLQTKAYFNLGNCYVKKNDVLKAIESYQQALRLTPTDEDAKFNLELIRRHLKSGPSERALELKKQLDELIKHRQYADAAALTEKALQEEPTFAKFGEVIQRVKDLAEIFGGQPSGSIQL